MSDGMESTRPTDSPAGPTAMCSNADDQATAATDQASGSRPGTGCRLLHPGNYPDFSVLPWANFLNHASRAQTSQDSAQSHAAALRDIKMLTVEECKAIIRRHLDDRQGRLCSLQDILDNNPDGEIGLFLLATIEMASEDDLEVTQNNDKHTGDARTITMRFKADG